MQKRDVLSAVKHLDAAIVRLQRIEASLTGEDGERFGHTLHAALLANNSLLLFVGGGWGMDAGHVRLEADGTYDDGS